MVRDNNGSLLVSTKTVGNAALLPQSVNQKTFLFVFSVAVLMALINLIGNTITSTTSTTSSLRWRNVNFNSDSESDWSVACLEKLDALDQFSDQKRQSRMQTAEEARKAGKNVYEFLWKVDVHDDKSKQREESDRKKLLFDLFEPEAICLTEERLGGESKERFKAYGDGPKFVCAVDFLRESKGDNCLVYSVGSNNNILFERAVKQHIGCEIHTFDPTLRSPFVGGDYAAFHPWGLGKHNKTMNFGITFVARSVEDIMKELGHTGRKIDIFKIDCEGCEYDAMLPVFDAMTKGSLQIDQLLIEIHASVFTYETLTMFFASADKAGLRITHKERNGWGCGGTGCIEYAFVSSSFLRRATAAAIC